METSILLFEQIMIFFMMIGMGAIVVVSGLLKSEDSKILSIITVYLVLPCVILHSFQLEFTKEIAYGIAFSFCLAILVHLLFLLLIQIGSKIFHYTNIEKVTILYSNAGNMIIPIISVTLGNEWVIYSSTFIAVQLIFLWTHGNCLLSNTRNFQWKKIFKNMNMIAIVIGVLLYLFNIRFPNIIDQTLESVGSLLSPLSMFITGMLVTRIDMRKTFQNKRLYHICFMRLIIYPIIFLLFVTFFRVSTTIDQGKTILFITFMATITPASSTIIQMAQINHQDATYASALNCASTLLCCVSMPIMVMIYNCIYQIF